ncbi:MAG TPA: P1 family peptidase [bacterium]
MISSFSSVAGETRNRAREIGIEIGVFRPGAWNAITDVVGVAVGHSTVIKEPDVCTGVTAILPHQGNLFQMKVPAAIYIGNGFGKLSGYTQVAELGNIETPILLTNTMSVPKVADAVIDYMLAMPGNENVQSINPVVGETNDGWLNHISKRAIGRDEVLNAITSAQVGPVAEGSVGAGTGTICLGFKGGIGTSSRVLPKALGGYCIGVLVQTNFGGILDINGAPAGRELRNFAFMNDITYDDGDGSCMIVVATDAPLSSRNLKRLAKRAYLALAKTGAFSSNGSGDYVIAFSNYSENLIDHSNQNTEKKIAELQNDAMSSLFLAVVEATQESIYNSLLKATTVTGRNGHKVEAIPIDRVIEICKKYNALNWNQNLSKSQ